jgi:predicted kinase
MKTLVLLRGLPGAGKSTVASMFNGAAHFEADMYFMVDGEYRFDASKLPSAHQLCQLWTKNAMKDSVETIVVSNTLTQQWELDKYYELAKEYDYRVISLIVENRHGGKNVHDVPDEVLDKMEARFEVKLK